ncbi:MAG: GGDEF domain-containing phosphodiesterase [Lachnospiraceae bacterium]|nr:GGDEF domain-containing phosphodiesterase [Lachnospiraceae bacterium]
MDRQRTDRYYQLLEQMVDAMNDPENFNRDHFIEILTDIAKFFRLSKGVTEFYKTISQEKIGDGEVLIDFDDGSEGRPIVARRLVTRSMAVVKGTLYQSDNVEPLTDEEKHKLDIMLRALLGFVSLNRLQNAVERMGFFDENNYPNLRSFKRAIEAINVRHALSEYTSACFNLRHFTLINQEIGREKADLAMRNYFLLITSLVGKDGIVCRMGGDNFVAIFKNELTEKIKDAFLGAPVFYDESNDKRIQISARAGLFSIPEEFILEHYGFITEKIISTALIARQDGNGPIVKYENALLEMKEKHMKLQAKISKALDNDEFRVYYQPKVDIRTGNIVGAEALCRWECDGKIIMPGEFIPILEQSMEICRLDFHILDLVCRDIRRWLAAGRKAVKISVNLSRKHLVDVDLLDHILEVIDRYEVPHRYIEIEFTETTSEVAFTQLKQVVMALQDEGIYTAVDDFGVGYSSLNIIREIPWNVLKIDKCFLPEDSDKKSSNTSLMYTHVVSMGRDLGLECITEGVETLKQVETLRNCRCYFAQGYIFDKPLPAHEFEKRLDNPHYDVP